MRKSRRVTGHFSNLPGSLQVDPCRIISDMNGTFLQRLTCMAVTAQLLVGCSMIQMVLPTPDLSLIQTQRAESATRALQKLENVDTLIKLNNHWLEKQLVTELKAQAVTSDQYNFNSLNLVFGRQMISMKGTVDIRDSQGNTIAATASGDVLLKFSRVGIEWIPRFSQIVINSKDFVFNDENYVEPTAELSRLTLKNLNAGITTAIVEQQRNMILLDAIPLGEVQVGATLPGFNEIPARDTQSLRGIFMVVGSVTLIEISATSVALDMTFIPDLSTCPADVTVSRAEFARDIEAREPVGIAATMNDEEDDHYSYSEISGAKRPLTIIHYWFADGLPVAVEELAVGPSERWRTWSANGGQQSDTLHWEVLVVEKESGCILHSQSIRKLEPEITPVLADQARARQAFNTLNDDFNFRTAGFSISKERPKIALIEVTRPFLGEVLQAAVVDLNMNANFDSAGLSELSFSSRLQPFNTKGIACEQRNCFNPPLCSADLSQCKRLRDMRDCSSCLFRNPLNNRCVREAIDPLCEASRNRQNVKYDTEWKACVDGAESARQECDQLNQQALRSCQIESSFDNSKCESIKNGMASLTQGTALASVSGKAMASGSIRANFTNFRIEDNLTRLKLDVTLRSNLKFSGQLYFDPENAVPELAECIADWDAPFTNRFMSKPRVDNLISNFEESATTFTTNWSGFGLTIDTNTSPLESIFVGNPQLLAACEIGLTVNTVERALMGGDADFFRGNIPLEIQPLPTTIHLAPATIQFGESIFSAQAQLMPQRLLYDIRD